MNYSSLIKARRLLGPLWSDAQLKGRCWGRKMRNNPFSGSNITIASNNEIISISQNPDGGLTIHEFKRTTRTLLGKEVRTILKKHKIKI